MTTSAGIRVIGLTGGIATGKSSVARYIMELGGAVIDADELARQVVCPGSPALERILAVFGMEMLQPDGSLDRQRLGKIVFADTQKRHQLEQILHPEIRRLAAERIAVAADQGHHTVFYMAPLLIEAGATEAVDEIWVITVKPEIQLERLMSRDGLSREEALRITACQMPLSEKALHGRIVIDNSGTPAETQRLVTEIWLKEIGTKMTEQTHIIRKGTVPVASPDHVLNCFAAVPRGAEEVAARELEALGIKEARAGRGGVAFVTDRKGLYRANLWLRSASRVLVQLAVFPCSNPAELYAGVHAIDWSELITPTMTLSVDCSLRDSALTHSGFVALKTKDAIVDRIREACGSRPSVDTASPDVRVNVHLLKNICTVSLDSSGDALDRRGYRLERTEAPMRETLAATIIALTGWNGSVPLVDPMCGSGTIPIEAALMAARMPPGLQRSFGFQRWLGFDGRLWDSVVKEAESGVREIPVGLITGYDLDARSLARAAKNAAKAGFEGQLNFFHAALEAFRPETDSGVVIINPPYGKRLGEEDELKELYCQIGDIMKQRCRGWTGFVITGNLELAKYIGLKASRRFVLFNGPIECRLLRYELY